MVFNRKMATSFNRVTKRVQQLRSTLLGDVTFIAAYGGSSSLKVAESKLIPKNMAPNFCTV